MVMCALNAVKGMIFNMKNSTDLYIEEIQKIPLLTLEEEQELGRKIKDGDNYAINKMVEHNLRLVIPIAKHYMNRGIDFNDLIQYGNLGLIDAAEKYDVTKGKKFSTYATYWIRQKISRAVEEDSRNIKLPNRIYRSVQKYNAQKQKQEKLKGHKLSYEELQKEFNLTIDEIKDLEKLSQDTVSLNTKIESDNSKTDNYLEDIITDDYLLEDDVICKLRDEELMQLISEIIDDARNIEITIKKYRELLTGNELAEHYGISQTEISQIIRKNMRKIRSSKKILDFLNYAYNEKEVIKNLQPHNPYVKIKNKQN